MTSLWAVLPARGGSKSIPRKNLAPLAGRPLLDYGAHAALGAACFQRIICSTDDTEIADRARELGIEADMRPRHLATDDAKVDDAVCELLERAQMSGAELPDIVVLVQPTSPFARPADFQAVASLLERNPAAGSAHNCTRVHHNVHAWNQRQIGDDGSVTFLFAEERARARNKQAKPILFAFGNVIAARANALLAGGGFYAEPCLGLEIESPYDFDVDQPEDLALAEAIIRSGLVVLDHMSARLTTTSDNSVADRATIKRHRQ